jgi:hypothetical protein
MAAGMKGQTLRLKTREGDSSHPLRRAAYEAFFIFVREEITDLLYTFGREPYPA